MRTQAIQCVSPFAASAQPMFPYDRSDRIALWPGLARQLATADWTGFGMSVLVYSTSAVPGACEIVVEAVACQQLLDPLVSDRVQAIVHVSREVGGFNGRRQAIVGTRRRRRAEDEHNPQQQVSHCAPA